MFSLLMATVSVVMHILFLSIQVINSTEESEILEVIPVHCGKGISHNGYTVVDSFVNVEIHVHGNNLKEDLEVGLSDQKTCEYVDRTSFNLLPMSNGHLGILRFILTPTDQPLFTSVPYYICIKSTGKWIHQKTHGKPAFYLYKPLMTSTCYVILIVTCFLLSALLTGLNVGVLSLNVNELRMLRNTGTNKEKRFAKKLIPIRKRGNYFMCSIVIAATLCNSIATISLSYFTSAGLLTVVITTVVIVLLCEILPQTLCTYFPLSIAGYTVYVTMACMIITAPISYPLALILNCLLHEELANRFTRPRIVELMKMARIPSIEEKIISGALELNEKKVEDIMTPLHDIFKLSIDTSMDFDTKALILDSGYSRIPIYHGKHSNICHVLLTKELILLDPDMRLSIKNLVKNSKYLGHIIPKGTTLDKAYLIFKDSRDHMAFIVDNVTTDGEEKNIIGLITFEDVIEEIFQLEINDETDTYSDNQTKRRLTVLANTNQVLSQIKTRQLSVCTIPSKNSKLSTFHFLSGINMFSANLISRKVLMSLLGLDVFFSAGNKKPKKLPEENIYISGVATDYFIMLVEGRMEVILESDLKIEVEPYRHFGIEALQEAPFIPDFTLRAVKKCVYLKISKLLYNAAVLATRHENFNEIPNININSDLYKYYKLLIETNSSS